MLGNRGECRQVEKTSQLPLHLSSPYLWVLLEPPGVVLVQRPLTAMSEAQQTVALAFHPVVGTPLPRVQVSVWCGYGRGGWGGLGGWGGDGSGALAHLLVVWERVAIRKGRRLAIDLILPGLERLVVPFHHLRVLLEPRPVVVVHVELAAVPVPDERTGLALALLPVEGTRAGRKTKYSSLHHCNARRNLASVYATK